VAPPLKRRKLLKTIDFREFLFLHEKQNKEKHTHPQNRVFKNDTLTYHTTCTANLLCDMPNIQFRLSELTSPTQFLL
jgi:hypothetical protein